MKKFRIVCVVILIITLLISALNVFLTPLSDVIVRIDHIIMLIAISAVALCNIRIKKKTDKQSVLFDFDK